MRILAAIHQFYPEYSSGTEKFLLNLASMLQNAGHCIEIVTYTLADGSDYRDSGELRVREYAYNGLPVTAVRHRSIPLDIHTQPDDSRIRSFALQFLRRTKYDLLHLAHPMRLTAFAAAASEIGIPYVMTLTDFWTICPKIILQTTSGDLCSGPDNGKACSTHCPELAPEVVLNRLRMNKVLLSNAAAIAVPSHFVGSMVKKEIPGLNLCVIPHGMNLSYLQPNRRTYKAGDSIVFAYCGGLAPHKGVHTLIRTFREVPFPMARLDLYGTASDETYLSLLKDLAQSDSRIRFCGAYTEYQVGEVFRRIDVLVIPSLCYESYSMVLQEALACAVPVVVSRLGALQEKVRDSETGFTFHAGDYRDLRRQMVAIAENPETLNQIKACIQRIAPALIEEEAFLYERVYRNAVASRPLEQAKAL